MGASQWVNRERYPAPAGPLRLVLTRQFGEAAIDGVWRPWSRDLTREGAHLVDAFPSARGRIDRIVYSTADWDVVADDLFTSHGRIKVGFFPTPDLHLVLVRLLDSRVLRFQVIPERLMDSVLGTPSRGWL